MKISKKSAIVLSILFPFNAHAGNSIICSITSLCSGVVQPPGTTGNTVSINGGTNFGDIYGANSLNDTVKNNTVMIHGGDSYKDIVGGVSFYGGAENNTVIYNNTVDFNYIAAGTALNAGNAINNKVIITSGNLTGPNTPIIYGGVSYDGIAENNSIDISGGSFHGLIYAGSTNTNTAKNNTLTITGGTWFETMGAGHAINANATINNNTLTILGGTNFKGIIYGGTGYTGNVHDNTVILKNNLYFNTYIVGGAAYDTNVSNNSLRIIGNDITFGPIARLYGGMKKIEIDPDTTEYEGIYGKNNTLLQVGRSTLLSQQTQTDGGKFLNGFDTIRVGGTTTATSEGVALLPITVNTPALFDQMDVVIEGGNQLNFSPILGQSMISTDGKVTLEGDVSVQVKSQLGVNKIYTLVEADQGIIGANHFQFLDGNIFQYSLLPSAPGLLTVSITANTIPNVINNPILASIGNAVGRAFNNGAGGVIDAVVDLINQDTNEGEKALQALTGDISGATILPVSLMGNINDILYDRPRVKAPCCCRNLCKTAVWGQYLYNHTNQNDKRRILGYQSNSNGFIIGVERADNESSLGAAVSYINTEAHSKIRHLDIETYALSLYGRHIFENNMYVAGTASYGYNKYTQDQYPAGFLVSSDYDGNLYDLSAEFGQKYNFEHLDLTPKTRLRYSALDIKSYRDTVAQQIYGRTYDVLTAGVGAQIDMPLFYDIAAEASLMLNYDLKEDRMNLTGMFSSTSGYIVNGTEPDRFGVETRLALVKELRKQMKVSLIYDGEYKANLKSHTASVQLRYDF